MNQRSFFGVLLDTCSKCAGIFFDEGEINQIRELGGTRAFDELDHLIQPDADHTYENEVGVCRTCPGCSGEMRRFRYMYSSPVFLDSCDNCGGIWIDNGELQQMREYIESARDGRLAPTPSKQSTSSKLEVLSAIENARARRARIAASMVAYRRDIPA